jgi:hypothetical protein
MIKISSGKSVLSPSKNLGNSMCLFFMVICFYTQIIQIQKDFFLTLKSI